ncbi:MAG TPA: META domain-containing protein [Agriterribacter sp.]|nr:META domain-containing protein [Agriterribacter sp.]
MKQIIVMGFGVLLFFSDCKSANVNNAKSNNMAASSGSSRLNGTWQLEYISGPRIAFQGLYPDKKPFITFDTSDSSFSGNTSCNSYRGKLQADDQKILFGDDMAMTRMMCPGEGEPAFVTTLKKINRYTVHENSLTLMMDDIAMMRFSKKTE